MSNSVSERLNLSPQLPVMPADVYRALSPLYKAAAKLLQREGEIQIEPEVNA